MRILRRTLMRLPFTYVKSTWWRRRLHIYWSIKTTILPWTRKKGFPLPVRSDEMWFRWRTFSLDAFQSYLNSRRPRFIKQIIFILPSRVLIFFILWGWEGKWRTHSDLFAILWLKVAVWVEMNSLANLICPQDSKFFLIFLLNKTSKKKKLQINSRT